MGVAGLAATVAALGLADSVPAQSTTSVLPISLAEGSFAGLPPAEQGRFQHADSGLAEVGDVNGDGLVDVAIGAASADPLGRRDAGVVHVVFGGSPLGRIDLGSPGLPGFRVIGPHQGRRRPAPVFQPDGPPAGAMAGSAVAGAGDVNGDGLDDIVVGAPYAGNRGRAFSGSAYVVFGKRSGEPVDLARLGTAGFRIDGPRRDAAAGFAVAGPGDVSGDGRPDVLVSSGAVQRAGAYVVLGQAGTASVDLRRLGGRGFEIRGGGRRRLGDAGAAISGAGDFNGDGVADIAVGAPQSGPPGREGAGLTFVVFGGPPRGPVRLTELGARGVRIAGEHEFANLGEALAGLGDVNGDGRGDLLIGASQVTAPGRRYAGAAYVVFGRASAGLVDLRRPDGAAYRVLGPGRDGAGGGLGQARAGVSVAAIADVDGDGRRDMLIGAPGAGRRCSPEEGAAYVVFSRPVPAPLDLGDLGDGGYAIRGGAPDANAGTHVAGAGDWNRDGRGDALVLGGDFDDSRLSRPPSLDLLVGRVPPPRPAAGPTQLPSVELLRPSLRRFVGRRGLGARITVNESGPADAVLVEVLASAPGPDLPIAVAYAGFSKPGTKTVHLVSHRIARHFLRRRSRVRARVVVSQCTTAGYEYTARSRIVLRRAPSRAPRARARAAR